MAEITRTTNYTHTDTYGVNVVLTGGRQCAGARRVRRGRFHVTGSGQRGADGSTKLERVHLTIVSGHTAYIDGNIVKGDPDKASTCAILARDYVCVNTTQFMQQRNQGERLDAAIRKTSLRFANEIGPGTFPRRSFDASVSVSGLDPRAYGGNTPKLLVRHASYHGAPTLMNLLINPALRPGL